jgi:transglutaminase-like putative cysteine protease
VEAYVGHRWYLFDPSGTAIPMGFIRLATGRDAADAAFASIFGGVEWQRPLIEIEAIAGEDGVTRLPERCEDALSTDAGLAEQ